MKKNTMMRLASVLLIAVLMSTCAISGTFAKYVTSEQGSDTARVAKFGVEINPNGDLFLTEYGKTDLDYSKGDNTVETSDSWKLVAPGTTKSLTEIELTGTPEVAVRVTYEAAVSLENWLLKDGTTEYCPVYFTIEGKTYGIANDCGVDCDVKATSVSDLAAKIKAAIENCKNDYAPKTDLSTVSDDYPSVAWAWTYHIDDDHDKHDTELGDKAADNVTDAAKITITIKTTVTQID